MQIHKQKLEIMGISQEAEKLQVKCSSNIIFFFEFAWILANIAAAQMLLMCTEHTDLFAISLCVKLVSFWAPGNPRMLEANPSIKKSMLLISKNSKTHESVTEL